MSGTSRHAPYGFTLTPDGRLEANPAEREMILPAAECRAAGYSWEGTARELDRLDYRTRSGRPWTWNNVRSALATATRIGTVPST